MKIIEPAIAKLGSEQVSEWDEIRLLSKDPIDSLKSWTPEHRLAVRLALADYACSQLDAMVVLSGVAQWSRRLGVSLACVVAREALRFVPKNASSAIGAVETAERWVIGKATETECKTMFYMAMSTDLSTVNARFSASYAAYAAYCDYPDTGAANAAYYASAAAADANSGSNQYRGQFNPEDPWHKVMVMERVRLCSVISESLRTGSVGEWIG